MGLLLTGVLLFSVVHLFPAVASGRRQAIIARLGEGPYKGVFALIILAAIVIIVLGWKSAIPSPVYTPPLASGPVTSALVLVGFVLFISSRAPTNLKRLVRHPQMTGTLLWSVAHLLSNGDSRSIILFGGLGVWAVLEMILCSRRDGAWQKPAAVPIRSDLIVVVVAAIGFGFVLYFHAWLFGVSPMAMS